MEDYKIKYQMLHHAASKAIEALQNAMMDIENMGMSPDEELLPGYPDGANRLTYVEEKEQPEGLGR